MHSIITIDSQQRELINEELKILQDCLETINLKIEINDVIISEGDEVTFKDSYSPINRSDEGVIAWIEDAGNDDNAHVVISPRLFTADYDTQTRLFIYFQELFRVYGERSAQKPRFDSPSATMYFEKLSTLFIEYSSYRRALSMLDKLYPGKSDLMQKHIDAKINDYIELINDEKHVTRMNYELSYYRFHRNVEKLLNLATVIFLQVATAILRLHAITDIFSGNEEKKQQINESKFVNQNTEKLMEFLRSQFDQGNPQLIEGISIIEEFMANFGLTFSDTEKGLHCQVMDI